MNIKPVRITCSTDHIGSVPAKKLGGLPESQASAWRHKCAACAYELGFKEGQRALRGKVVHDLDQVMGHLHS
jgi:hypothetical protein